MAMKIESAMQITVGTTEETVDVQCRDFIITNTSDTATVYLKEKETDGVAATAENAFALLPGVTVQKPLTANVLSMVASAADTKVTLLLGRELQ